MGGENCWVPECGLSRDTPNMYFWKIPCTAHPLDIKWREDVESMVRRYRVVTSDLADRLKDGNVFTCERHFREEDFDITPTGRKKVKLYVMPTLNLPKKKHETVPATPRPLPQRAPLPAASKRNGYGNIQTFIQAVKRLKITPWTFTTAGNEMSLYLSEHPSLVPKFSIKVDPALKFKILVFNWPLPEDHPIYKKYQRSFHNVYLKPFLKEMVSGSVCPGVSEEIDGTKLHSVPIEVNMSEPHPQTSNTCYRASGCHLLSTTSPCNECIKTSNNYSQKMSRHENNINVAAKPNAPLSTTHPNKIILALKEKRAESKKQKTLIERLQKEIQEKSVEIEDVFGKVVTETMTSHEEKGDMTPFVKLMWEEQKKYRAQGSPRFHPMIIRYALSLSLKSRSTYNELRRSGILILPSERTLQDYKNAITPEAGFNYEVVEDLKKKCENLVGIERFIVLSFDEVKIQSNLIFDKHSGKVIGFVDVGDDDLNSGIFSNQQVMATHVLCFFVRDLIGNIKFNFGYFGTHGILAHQLMPLFWKAVSILELSCFLMVIAAVCDGASANRKFIKMHALMGMSIIPGVTHRSVNLFSPDRFIWFFSDYPHLMKTARNCLSHSGFGDSHSRLLWNGRYLLWQHIREILKLNRDLKVCPKFKEEHVDLTSRTRMKVNLAVQTLSATNAALLQQYVASDFPDAIATAEFCSLMNIFFDIMNVRNPRESSQKIKPNCAVFESVDDERFDWLVNVFLKYFDDWMEKISSIPGISAKQKEKMFISRQTMEGLKITVYSMIQCTKFLIQSGMRYVLTEKFCQDTLELYFELQRACGIRADNPSLYEFGYNDNGIRQKGNLAKTRVQGNVKGGLEKSKYSWYAVDNKPMPKRQKKDQ